MSILSLFDPSKYNEKLLKTNVTLFVRTPVKIIENVPGGVATGFDGHVLLGHQIFVELRDGITLSKFKIFKFRSFGTIFCIILTHFDGLRF